MAGRSQDTYSSSTCFAVASYGIGSQAWSSQHCQQSLRYVNRFGFVASDFWLESDRLQWLTPDCSILGSSKRLCWMGVLLCPGHPNSLLYQYLVNYILRFLDDTADSFTGILPIFHYRGLAVTITQPMSIMSPRLLILTVISSQPRTNLTVLSSCLPHLPWAMVSHLPLCHAYQYMSISITGRTPGRLSGARARRTSMLDWLRNIEIYHGIGMQEWQQILLNAIGA